MLTIVLQYTRYYAKYCVCLISLACCYTNFIDSKLRNGKLRKLPKFAQLVKILFIAHLLYVGHGANKHFQCNITVRPQNNPVQCIILILQIRKTRPDATGYTACE